jgi:hypothetical protein
MLLPDTEGDKRGAYAPRALCRAIWLSGARHSRRPPCDALDRSLRADHLIAFLFDGEHDLLVRDLGLIIREGRLPDLYGFDFGARALQGLSYGFDAVAAAHSGDGYVLCLHFNLYPFSPKITISSQKRKWRCLAKHNWSKEASLGLLNDIHEPDEAHSTRALAKCDYSTPQSITTYLFERTLEVSFLPTRMCFDVYHTFYSFTRYPDVNS